MWPRKRELTELHQSIKNSFSRVKEDNQNIFQWIQHLHQKNQEQEQLLNNLHRKNQEQEWLIHQIKNQPQNHQHYNYLQQRLEQVSQKVDYLVEKHQNHSQKLDDFHLKIQNLEAQRAKPKHSFKEKVIQTLSRHSKNYLKNLVFQYLEQHQNISALQLKDIIVDQQGLASKSTFYRLLAEIEKSPQVTVVKDGKQKYFLLKTILSQ